MRLPSFEEAFGRTIGVMEWALEATTTHVPARVPTPMLRVRELEYPPAREEAPEPGPPTKRSEGVEEDSNLEVDVPSPSAEHQLEHSTIVPGLLSLQTDHAALEEHFRLSLRMPHSERVERGLPP